ncbi:CHAT domain-containing protein [Achaetomium macrosporum]|uniref:CHAT domain-containing protein n=1 Tax=Achaetomium macrosporum TaxID=79813 RepID=A0AAN7C473_9PEZI|nr:CHAT domain-containing protein [Achaetomium macrosporum]
MESLQRTESLAGSLARQAFLLAKECSRTRSNEGLARAVTLAENAVDMTEQSDPSRHANLYVFGATLALKCEREGSVEALDKCFDVATKLVAEAITNRTSNTSARSSLRSTSPADEDRAAQLMELCQLLFTKHRGAMTLDRLDKLMKIAKGALAAIPLGESRPSALLNALASLSSERFTTTGTMADLSTALEFGDEALKASPPNSRGRAIRMIDLGHLLGSLFERTATLAGLDQAIRIVRGALAPRGLSSWLQARALNTISILYARRYERTGAAEDFTQATRLAREALETGELSPSSRARSLNNLAAVHVVRFDKSRDGGDLDEGIKLVQEALATVPQDAENRPTRAAVFNTLAALLCMKAGGDQPSGQDVVDEAVDAANMALELSSPHDTNRATYLYTKVKALATRLTRGKADAAARREDTSQIFTSIPEACNRDDISPSMRIQMIRAGGLGLTAMGRWGEASDFLDRAVWRLRTVSPRASEQSDNQHALAVFDGLASEAAALALKAGKGPRHALEALELARCLITGMLLEVREDISLLRDVHRDLAARFTSLRHELHQLPVDPLSPSLWLSRLNQRSEADRGFQDLVAEIRTKPGFKDFLRSPNPRGLITATGFDAIVVVNASVYRCDAILITRETITVQELPLLKLSAAEAWARRLQFARGSPSFNVGPLLEWLWDAIAGPVLDALGFVDAVRHDDDENWRRLCWIPTGILSRLPLHAAGYHTLHDSRTVLDRVMSSYASSLKTLHHGCRQRQHRGASNNTPVPPPTNRAVLVAMSSTPHLPADKALPYVAHEAAMLRALCPSLHLELDEPAPHKDAVQWALRRGSGGGGGCTLFHFAGHGRADALDPSRSGLLLDDWQHSGLLSVGALRAGRPLDDDSDDNPPFLAYLSACSTGANEAASLADEGIHLAGAFQLAGFRHVVGTLWEVSDVQSVEVARVFYETLRDGGMTDAAVCRGLHKAVRVLRDSQVRARGPLRDVKSVARKRPDGEVCLGTAHWVPYVHFGV